MSKDELGSALVRNGIIDAQAIDSPETYDNYETAAAIERLHKELFPDPDK